MRAGDVTVGAENSCGSLRRALLLGTALSSGFLLSGGHALATPCSFSNNQASYAITGSCGSSVTVQTNVTSTLTGDNNLSFVTNSGVGLEIKATGPSANTLSYSDAGGSLIVGGGSRAIGAIGNSALLFDGGSTLGVVATTAEKLTITLNGQYTAKPTSGVANDIGAVSVYGGAGTVNLTLDSGSVVTEIGTVGATNKMAGVAVQGGAGAVTITAKGWIKSDNAGIFAETISGSPGNVVVDNSGRIAAGGDGVTTGVLNAGAVDFTNSGTIKAGGAGIYAFSLLNSVTVDGTGGTIGSAATPTGGPGIFAATVLANKEASIVDTGDINSGAGAPSHVPTVSIPGLASFAPFSGGAIAISVLDSAQIGQQGAAATPGANLYGDAIATSGNYGLVAIGGGGAASIYGSGSTVTANSGMGILAVAGAGDATVESGKVTSGSGGGLTVGGALVSGLTIPKIDGGVAALSVVGNASVTTFGDTTTTGNFGVFAAGVGGGATVTTTGATVDTTNGGATTGGTGIFAFAGVNDATVNAGTTISGVGEAITLPTIDGVSLSSLNGGVIAASVLGSASVTTAGDTTTGGNYGVFALGGLGAAVTTTGTTVTANNGVGIFALGAGADVAVQSGVVNSGSGGAVDTPAFSVGPLNFPAAALSGGIVAASLAGNVSVTTGGDTTTTGNDGVFAGALGKATVANTGETINANGGTGITALGGGDVTINTGAIASSGAGGGLPTPALTLGPLSIPSGNLDGGVVALSVFGATQVTADGDVTTSGDFGVFAGSLTGSVTVTTTGQTIAATNGTGIFAVAARAVTVDAGAIVGGSTAGYVVPAFSISSISLPASADGGVIAASLGGDVTVNLHGDVNTPGTLGALAVSGSGAATVVSDAGVTIDPAVGLASATLGAGLATVANNGTVASTVAGLLAVNLGDGAALVQNSATGDVEASTGAGVVVVKVGPNSNPAPSADSPTGGANYAVIVANQGTINAPNGPGVSVIAGDPTLTTPNEVQVYNAGRSALILGEGGLLTPAIGVATDGAVDIANTRGATVTTTIGPDGTSGVAMTVAAGGDVSVLNDKGAAIYGQIELGSLGDATFTNDKGGVWSASFGLSVVAATGDATINNDRGARIDMLGVGALGVVAGGAATINNDRGASISLVGLNGAFEVGGTSATINNSRGARIDMFGLNGVLMEADGGAATINNDRGARLNLLGGNVVALASTNGDAVVNNTNGGVINAVGLNAVMLNSSSGVEALNNAAAIDVAGALELLGAHNLQVNNSGLVDMRGGHWDQTYVGGSFNGLAGSALGVDAQLGAPGSRADWLGVTGNVTGLTSIIVRDVDPGPAAYNPLGAAVVGINGTGNASNFSLSSASDFYSPRFGGVLDKGLFFYYLGNDDPSSVGCGAIMNGKPADHCVALYSAPGVVPQELPRIVTGAVNVWDQTALMWEDRQSELRSLVYEAPAPAAALPTRKAPQDGQAATATDAVWAKVLGSWTNRNGGATFAGDGGRTFDFDLGYHQNIYGILGGLDVAKQGLASANDTILAGVMGGYVDSTLSFKNGDDNFRYQGGTVGASLSYLNGGVFADALIKADFLTINVNTPSLASFGFAGGSVRTTTWGTIGNLGYHWQSSGAFFIEPMATLAFAETHIGNLEMPALSAQASFGDGESLRGALGARFGANMPQWNGHAVLVSLTGRVWNEFLGDRNAMTLTNPGEPVTLSDNFKGVSGEVKGGVDIASLGPGWGAFVNGGVEFKSRFNTVEGKAGVSYAW